MNAHELANVIATLRELLEQERDHPESLANGHGRALAVAIEVLKEQFDKL
jgi:hypothetical protein